MNRDEAKSILSLYRPGTADARDADFAEALRLSEGDPELKRWFDEHCAAYALLHAKFRQIEVPAGLKEQILAERKVHFNLFPPRVRLALATAAAFVAITILLVTVYRPAPPVEEAGLPTYLNWAVGFALRGYGMETITNEIQIRSYFVRNHAPSDYAVPRPLQQAVLTGCAYQTWEGGRVSVICFHSGKSLPPGQENDLWLFVAPRSSLPGAPTPGTPMLEKVNRAMTATWSEGDRTYVLVADGDADFIRKYL